MTQVTRQTEKVVLLAAFFAFVAVISSFSYGFDHGPNWINVSIDTTVNITSAPPEFLSVYVENSTGIVLNAGANTTVLCHANLKDYNGGSTITEVNATLFDNFVNGSGDPDNYNSHYTNGSCTEDNVNGYFANYTCSFTVRYYANNGTDWRCNVTARDNSGYVADDYNTTVLDKVMALNVTSPIDYGDLAAGDTSTNLTANITNIGNVEINVSVYGYGNQPGDGLAMVCAQGNVSVGYEKFSSNLADDYAAKTALSGSVQQVGFTLSKQVDEAVFRTNTTYWQLQIPLLPIFGRCNGTIVFTAEDTNPI